MDAALVIRPIDLADLWAFLATKNRTVAPANYRAVSREVVAGRVLGAFAAARIIGIGAVSQISEEQPPIAWMSVTDDGFGRFGVGAVRSIRAVLAQNGGAIALVEESNEAGRRLARLVGLTATDAVTLGMRVWRSGGRDHRKISQAASSARG